MHDLPRHPVRPHLVPPVRPRAPADPPDGRPTRHQVARGEWRRVSHGFYVPAWVVDDPEQRVLEAAARLPSYGGVTGWGALRWQGATWFDGEDRVGQRPLTIVTTGADVRRQPGLDVSEERLAPAEIVEVDGLRVTTAVRSVCFEMRHARTLWEAVEALDMAAYADLVDLAEVATYVDTRSGSRGVGQARAALALGDENSWSPPETWLRLVWELHAGRNRPLTNRPVFDRRGTHVGTPDLIDPEAGVIGEYDGALHLSGRQRGRDVAREAAYRRIGLECVVVVAADRQRADRVVARIDEAYERASLLPAADRAWTVVPPQWWTQTVTVAQRRSLGDDQRQRLLGHRTAA